jgi:hypothetical protein
MRVGVSLLVLGIFRFAVTEDVKVILSHLVSTKVLLSMTPRTGRYSSFSPEFYTQNYLTNQTSSAIS